MRDNQHRLGQHYTSEIKLLLNYKEILLGKKDKIIIDPFCGEGHLLHFYLSLFSKTEQLSLLKNKRIMGFDISKRNIEYIKKQFKSKYNLSDKLLSEIFQVRDSLLETSIPKNSYILTNPPYLGKNICKRNYKKDFNKYFLNKYKLKNDYFEIALSEYSGCDGLWITPSNLFSSDIMKNIRKKIGKNLHNIIIYEKKTFQNTDISVATYTIENNNISDHKEITFISDKSIKIFKYKLDDSNNFVKEWEEIKNYKNKRKIYQGYIDSKMSEGTEAVFLIDTKYNERKFNISKDEKDLLKKNILILRTTDTGSENGRIGLYTIEELFNTKKSIGLITKQSSRVYTQLFIDISIEKQLRLKEDFNMEINRLRTKYNSIFLTNFKNSSNGIQRKRISFKEAFSLINLILDRY